MLKFQKREIKVDEANEKCIFLVMHHSLKVIGFFSFKSKKMIVSKDVLFDENATLN